jgi:hypothetical protein
MRLSEMPDTQLRAWASAVAHFLSHGRELKEQSVTTQTRVREWLEAELSRRTHPREA